MKEKLIRIKGGGRSKKSTGGHTGSKRRKSNTMAHDNQRSSNT